MDLLEFTVFFLLASLCQGELASRRTTVQPSRATLKPRQQQPHLQETQKQLGKTSTTSTSGRPKGRILEGPVPYLCATRQIHEIFDNKGYWYSWRDSTNNREWDWLDGRNYCRKRCMDLVSLETSLENELIKSRIVEGRQKYIWTSGRLCDFKACEGRDDLKPIAINGWFWSAELKKMAPTTDRFQTDWSNSGGLKKPQPDNREFQQGGPMESCLAVLNNFYKDGVHWHDVACHHRKPIVCEDSTALLNYIRYTNPGIQV